MNKTTHVPDALIFLHTETTGLNPWYGDHITEIGVLKVGSENALSHIGNIECTHIYLEQGQNKISKAELEEFASFIGNLPIVCFYAEFHMNFILHECEKAGISLTNEWICACEMARDLVPDAPSYRLLDLTASMSPPDSLPGVLGKAYRTLALYGTLL